MYKRNLRQRDYLVQPCVFQVILKLGHPYLQPRKLTMSCQESKKLRFCCSLS